MENKAKLRAFLHVLHQNARRNMAFDFRCGDGVSVDNNLSRPQGVNFAGSFASKIDARSRSKHELPPYPRSEAAQESDEGIARRLLFQRSELLGRPSLPSPWLSAHDAFGRTLGLQQISWLGTLIILLAWRGEEPSYQRVVQLHVLLVVAVRGRYVRRPLRMFKIA